MTTTRGRQLLARATGLAVALPLSAGALVAAAPAAGAAVNQPVEGSTFTSYRTVDISADYGGSAGGATERLLLTPPGGAEVEVKAQPGSVNGGALSYTLDLGCWTSECRLVPNGSWTVRQGGSTNDTSTFVTRIAPAAPTGVRAEPASAREVRVSWRVGPEPDLVAWDVYEGSAAVVTGVKRGSCSGTTCSAVVSYAAADSGEHAYTVRALRLTDPNKSSLLESPPSARASTTLSSAPTPAPSTDGGTTSPGDTDTGGGSGTGGGDTTAGGSGPSAGGGTSPSSSPTRSPGSSPAPAVGTGTAPAETTADQQAVAQRKAFALGFSAFGPKLGIPKLPPLPQAQEPAIAPEIADGTFEPTLGFEEQIVTERVETTASGPAERPRSVVTSALDSERLLRSTAGALVLLLAGAHLRRWLGSASTDH